MANICDKCGRTGEYSMDEMKQLFNTHDIKVTFIKAQSGAPGYYLEVKPKFSSCDFSMLIASLPKHMTIGGFSKLNGGKYRIWVEYKE